jgi:S-adenosylmethionine-diacylglycerol 3-amino-3-carboxypropyl transferase
MKPFFIRIRKTWFEVRIFISLSIVVVISLFSFLVFKNTPTTIEIAGGWLGLSKVISFCYGFDIIAAFVLLASLIRMWAGSILTSKTVMAFKVQNSKLTISGPYNFVRNPIYFADLIAFTSLSCCLRPIGLLIPVLICFHYYQLIKYEEEKLIARFGKEYEEYIHSVPGLIPGMRQLKKLFVIPLNFTINFDGFRHNAQYVLFIPGLIVAAHTGKFIHAILIGLPAVVDWAVIHTIIGVSGGSSEEAKSLDRKKFSCSKVFRDILYAQCWEDPEMDRIAFKIRPDDIVFSITSGGDNALAFLIDDPGKVICLDMNRYQNFLLSLKINAFKTLTYTEILEFFGVQTSKRRWELYEKIKPALPDVEQFYWDSKMDDINRGIIHCGRYERFMHLLKRIFRMLIGNEIINDLFNSSGEKERKILFDQKWNNVRWRLFCRVFLSRWFASLLFDKEFYKYIESSFSFEKYYRSAVRRAITELPVKENYFLAYILLGNYFERNFPVYLKEENYDLIRKRADRIKTVTSGCLEYFRSLPGGTISKFNFTNIFEWISAEEFCLLLKEIIRVAKDGAVITYRNHLVTRNRPDSLADQLIPDEKLSIALHDRDLSFIYKAYVVERIKKNQCHTSSEK